MSVAAPGIEGDISGRFTGAGEIDIFWQAWVPEGEVAGVVVLAHGAGEHTGRYAHVGRRLADAGFALYGLDHRGHGRSQGPRALVDRMAHCVADVHRLRGIAETRHPGVPVVLLGHSMGGTVAMSYVLVHADGLRGLVLSGPLAALDAAPAPLRVLARVLSAAAPRTPLIAVDPQAVSRDPAVVAAYVGDPLVFHGKLPARTVVELGDAIETFPDGAPRVQLPALVLYGTADTLCPTSGSVMLGDRLGGDDVTVRAYEGLYHEIFNEPERDRVLDDVVGWLRSRVEV